MISHKVRLGESLAALLLSPYDHPFPISNFLIPQAGTAYPYIVGTVALWTQSISLLLLKLRLGFSPLRFAQSHLSILRHLQP
jgi:hypothetical protein